MGRTITLNGLFTGTKAQQRTFIAAIDTIADGAQSGSTFVSSLITSPASRTVFIQSWDWKVNMANESKIEYFLILVEGAAVS